MTVTSPKSLVCVCAANTEKSGGRPGSECSHIASWDLQLPDGESTHTSES